MIETKKIIKDINEERTKQDDKWGGPEHDNMHNSHDWVAFITKHLGKSVMWPWDGVKFRHQMVRVAALAIAAIAWYDRTYGVEDANK